MMEKFTIPEYNGTIVSLLDIYESIHTALIKYNAPKCMIDTYTDNIIRVSKFNSPASIKEFLHNTEIIVDGINKIITYKNTH